MKRSILLNYSLLLISVLALAGTSVQGQTSATDGTTPATLAPGAPAGSYSLSDFEHINLFNGNLSAAFKLVQVTGRGNAQYNMTLPIQQRWRALNGAIDPFNDGNLIYFSQPESNWWDGIRPGYGPGVVQSRTVGAEPGNCNPQLYSGVFYPAVITRITFTSPNGSEHELVDEQTNGAVHHFGICGDQTFSRGKVFVSRDGTSGLTFVADQNITEDNRTFGMGTPSGVLKFPDGTQYRVDGGLVSSIRDRNGNKLTFTYGTNPQDPLTFARVISVTDSLNRVVTVSYANNSTIFYDQINFQGFGGASRIIRVHYTSLGQSLRAGYTLANTNTLFPQYIHNPNDPNLFNPTVVSAIELPDSRRYEFQYNNYSELARVELPTGGVVEYDHTPTSGVLCYVGDCTMSEIYRRIVTRRVYPDGGSSVPEGITTYSSSVVGMTATQPVTVDHLNATGTLQSREQHYFFGNAVPSSLQTVYWSSWKDGKEYQTDYFNVVNGTAGALMRRQTMDWRQRAPVSWCSQSPFGCTADSAPPNDPRVVETITTLTDVTPNLVSKQSSIDPSNGAIGFDQFNNPTELWEYDFGSGSAGALLRRTHTEYVTDPAYIDAVTGVHMRRLPTLVIVYDGSNNAVTKTSFAYDETSFPLLTYSSVAGWTNPNTTKRGNATTTSNWLNTNNTWLSSHTQFDQVGNVRKTWDPSDTTLINPAQIEYSADYHFAYPTTQISADPDLTTSGNGSLLPLTSTSIYDLSTGLVTSTTDPNGSVSQFDYTDPLDRLKSSVTALNTSAQAQSVINYDDANLKITRFNDLNTAGDSKVKSETVFDGLGRIIETRSYESTSNYIAVKTHYDALGRVDQTSNSFRPWLSETPVWTTTAFDALGRTTSVTTPDGSVVKTAYAGNRVLVEDQQHRIKINVSDVFDRLRELWEVTPADSATEAVTFPGYPAVSAGYVTRYGYDAIDNLTSVSQRFGASGTNQTRSFAYDSLKRLIGTTNPESGTISRQYDSDSNLTQQTDARGIVTTYGYDALNRGTSVDYSNTAINPDVTNTYDGATNGKGRLWKTYTGGTETVGTTVEKTLFESYDPVGRPLILKQYFKLNNVWSDPYRVSRVYNLAGGVTSQIYPSDRFVTYNYDNAARLADKDAQNLAFTGNLGGTSRTYSSAITYVASGLLKQEKFGTTTAVYRKLFYNSRQQLTAILANTTGDDSTWDRGKILNQYSLQCSGLACDANDNNGSLRKQEVYIPAGGQVPAAVSWYQQYDYDDLNRLKRVHEFTGNTLLDWQQEYVYDRWGNRTISGTNTWIGNSGNPPNVLLNEKQFDTGALATANRLYAPGDLALPENQRQMNYDAAGNLTRDIYTGYGNATFDANNRITAIQDITGSSSNYVYNAEGQRRRRISNNQETWQIYGFAGELLAEYPANGPVLTPTREYGYRNGQLLVVAAGSSGWGPAPTLADNPLQVGATTIQALHITQLRTAINALRSNLSMPAYSWTTSATTSDWINAAPILEMRTALDQALGAPSNGYAAGLAQNQTVLAVHIQELRDRVLAAWQTGSGLDLRWFVSDQLGSPRMIFDQSGSFANMNRHDYLPFGEELSAGIGLRTTAQRYVSDNVRQKFTLKERDTETNLDYFLARYYASLQGRFTGVDPAAGMTDDAQSWNRYSYARNSPLDMSDPDGRTYLICDPEGNNCVTYSDEEFYRIRRETEGQYGYTGDRDFFEQGQITENGQVIATYRQVTIDPVGENGRARQLAYHMRRAINDPKTMLKAASNIIFIRLLQNRTGSNTTGPGGPNRPLSFSEMSGMLRNASKQKGNFGMGSGSRTEAQAMGEAWVGVGYRVASDGKTLVSADGLRVFRPPSYKPKLGKEQANFEWKVADGGQPTGNGHLDIW